MNTGILHKLCCPICKVDLALDSFSDEGPEFSWEENNVNEGRSEIGERNVREGVLLCHRCNVWYPIFHYVPVMLTFTTELHRKFAAQHAERIRLLSGFWMPSGTPLPGEKSIQQTFTDEWDCVQNDRLSFLYTIEELKVLNEKVLLKWLGHSSETVTNVLEVGCGLGQESIALKSVMKNAEVFGVDLNSAVLNRGEFFKRTPGIHLVIASLFQLPFRFSSFDLVYSLGVIHHTFSTLEAFKSIASYVRNGGYLFIWVYGLDDHLIRRGAVGLITRLNYMAEAIARPVISASPKFLRDIFFHTASLILHPVIKSRVRHKQIWKVRNTNHDLRDWLSPRYAHRHSYNEVFEWFEDLGFRVIDIQSPAAYRRLFKKRLSGVGVTGNKIKESLKDRAVSLP